MRLLLHVLSDKILRFRYLTDGPLAPDFSYAVPAEAVARLTVGPVEFREKPDHYRLTTARLICIIQKDSLKTRVLDRSGTILSDDEKGFHWEYDYDTGNDSSAKHDGRHPRSNRSGCFDDCAVLNDGADHKHLDNPRASPGNDDSAEKQRRVAR